MKSSVLACLSVLLVSSLCAAAEAPAPVPNAALRYWMAFDDMPKKWSPAAIKMFDLGFKAPAGPDRDNFVSTVSWVLKEMRRGAAIDNCDWGIDRAADGITADYPHLTRMRSLARLAFVAARALVDEKHPEQAADLLVDTLKLARHTGSGHSLIERLVEEWIRRMGTQALAAVLPHLSAEQLKTLAAKLDALAPPTPLADVMRGGEKAMVTWLRGRVNTGEYKSYLETFEIPPELVKDLKAVLAELDNIDAILNEVAKVSEEPFAARAEGQRRIDALVAKAGPLAKHILPDTVRIRTTVERDVCAMVLLKAGVQILVDGEGAVAKTVDPYNGGKPFTYTKTEFGFELQSRFDGATPFKLTFGFDPNENPQATGRPVKPPRLAENVGEF